MALLSFAAALLSLLLTALVVVRGESEELRCSSRRSCGDCIAQDPRCSWCKQEDYGKYIARCDLKENLLKRNCSRKNIVSPVSEVNITKDIPLSEANVKSDSYVQLKPQRIHLKLRPHEVVSFPVEFRQAEDYPVDLYYLMDLTYSMRDDKEKLYELGDMLVDSMSNLTSNFRLGFGSFVDKVVLPYVNTVPQKLINPCLDGNVCVPPYGFRNHMPLSNNSKRFVSEVAKAEVSGNLDDAEGGFDAIMQVIVCKDQIDWNEKSRKIVLFATDSGFHYAGDGKLGGVVVPNDGKCHLDESGYYTMSTKQDYPSLSQINRKVKENKVILIFAVTTSQLPVYTRLSRAVEGAHTRKLAEDSSNIVHLVRKQYAEISSEVELKADNVPENVKISMTAICPDGKPGTNLCKGLKVGTTVSFNVSLELEGCPKSASGWSHQLTLYPVGLNEALQVQLEMVCECDCEMPNEEEANSTNCNGVGTYECGMCSCYDRHFGRECECNSTDLDEPKNFAHCLTENSTTACSGRGDCVCGICYCYPRDNPLEVVSGPQCQCLNFSCDRDEEQRICGGPKRGHCECGQCECHPGWTLGLTSSTCTCPTSNSACIGHNGLICSGNGQCKCGQCFCNKTDEGRYGGVLCEECPLCTGKCNDFRSCVECQVWESGDFDAHQCKTNCSRFQITTVPELQEDNVRKCTFQDSEGCTFKFTYSFSEDNRPIIKVLDYKQCPKTANLMVISLGVVGGILLVGLVIVLIARLCMFIKDRRDYARFLEELRQTTWGQEQNPIYKAAVSNYTNPTYGTAKTN